LKNQKS